MNICPSLTTTVPEIHCRSKIMKITENYSQLNKQIRIVTACLINSSITCPFTEPILVILACFIHAWLVILRSSDLN